ncbi:hypothetical protein K439DRAFT_756400 [Ramaria rubella]|nr:hypothetical protein K439DRAFT_756400 [Ramaria rubella]
MSTSEAPQKHKAPIAVPITLVAFGVTGVVVPLLLLRRARSRGPANDLRNASPPIRRISALSPAVGRATVLESSLPHETSQIVERTERPDPDNGKAHENAHSTGAALYALKALGIATCIVGASATVGVFAVRWGMDVQTMEEFATRIGGTIRSWTPGLSSRIYRTPSPSDPFPITNLNISTLLPRNTTSPPDLSSETGKEEQDAWQAGVYERLAQAYKEGGLARWMEAAEKELEIEERIERRRKGDRPVEP